MTSENNCIIEDVNNYCVEMFSDEIGVKEHDNFCDEPYDDSFDHNCGDAYIENVVGNVDCVVDNVHANPLENVGNINAKHDDENCFDTCENNSFNSMENNSIESCVDNFSNSYDSNSSNPCENNSFVSLNENDVLESFTFSEESLSNELANELHDMLCDVDEELNVDASLLDLNDVEFDTFHDNCLDDAIYIHDLLGEENEETDGDLRDLLLSSEKEEEKESVTIEKENEEENFENKNVMIEEVHCKIIEEEKEKTRNESVREEVEKKEFFNQTSRFLSSGAALAPAAAPTSEAAAFAPTLTASEFFNQTSRFLSSGAALAPAAAPTSEAAAFAPTLTASSWQKNCSEVPWKLPEDGMLSAAETENPVLVAAAQTVATAPPTYLIASASIAMPTLPHAATGAPPPKASTAQTHECEATVQTAVSNAPQPAVQDVNSTTAPSDLMQIAPSGSYNLSKHEITNSATLSAAVSKIPPTNLAVYSGPSSDTQDYKSTVAQMEKMMLEDKKLLQSLKLMMWILLQLDDQLQGFCSY
nr:hypothetical protein Iba_chr02aCG9210 [Ipomoea batatas]